MRVAPGTKLGPYEVLAPLGAGGMGEVFRARDTRLGRDVAVKVLPAELACDPERLRRFEQEARAVAALNHPNILVVHDVGSAEGSPYLVTELLEGESLRQSLVGGALTMRKAIDYAVQVARGLAVAHEKGIVHRDLKPENLFITRSGLVKILDFGLAKLRPAPVRSEEAAQATTLGDSTEAGTIVGTVPYMSPEQVRGQPLDHRTDIFSFGAVLYEMLSGRRAFQGATPADTLSAILKEDPPPLADLREAISPVLQQIVNRCLEKRPEDRFSSAHDLGLALEAVSAGPARASQQAAEPGAATAPSVTVGGARPVSAFARLSPSLRAHPWLWLLGGLAVLVAIAAASRVVVRQWRVAWVRSQALPELVRLADARDYWPAFLLAWKIETVVPDDPIVEKIRPRFVGELKRQILPAGAKVLARPRTGGEADWVELGEVKGKPIPAPLGYSVFKVKHPGFEPREFAMTVSEFGWDQFTIAGVTALARRGEAPDGMVRIETPAKGVQFGLESAGLFAFAKEGQIGSFFVDTHEVTNREFKRFVDAGGYRGPEYWTEPLERDSKTLSWDEAIALFRDTTGRPGPAGWQVGTYDAGTDEFPVTGVSWYEAAAYAAFAGKRLPSIYHFAVASARYVGGDFVPGSNFSGKLVPVGSYRGSLNYWGLYDVAGNAREWCRNAVAKERFALGGAADGPSYMFWGSDTTKSPFDRNSMTGFRCVKLIAPDPRDESLDAPIERKAPIDWAKMKGFSEDVLKTWQGLLSYGKGPLDARTEWTDDSLSTWRMEKVSFNADYPNERVVAYLFLPRNVPPPWQVVIYFPTFAGYLVSSSQDGRNTQDLSYWDYLVQDGRAVVYPIFKGAFERGGGQHFVDQPGMIGFILPAKDVFRTIDYLETRKDIRTDRLGYLGLSSGAEAGPLVFAVEKRFKAAVLLGAGLYADASIDGDMIGFSHHCSIPILMINGRFEGYVSQPLFNALATPWKRQDFFETDHTLAGYRKEVMKVSLEWFDRYLGPVR